MWYRSGPQLVPFDAFMQGLPRVDVEPGRPGSRVSTGACAHFGLRAVATRSGKNAGVDVAQVTAGTRCYTTPGRTRGCLARARPEPARSHPKSLLGTEVPTPLRSEH